MKRIVLALFVLYLSNAALAQSQQNTLEGELSLDEMSYTGKIMHDVFSELFIEVEHSENSTITSATDKELIRQAVTTSPHSIVGIEYLESGCKYLYETEHAQLSAARLADYFVQGSKEGEKVKFEFMTATYNALSEQTRVVVDSKVLRLESGIQRSTQVIPNVDESLQHFYQISRSDLISRYNDFCDGGLEELKTRLQNPDKVFQSGRVTTPGF
ncbi:MAG: hypothetical protein Q7L07_08215 [Pseudohongiella sp.]|nr:hypothetical protein [Pseudohongiella sp.]